MSNWDKDYLNLCRRILKEGKEVENRTGINTIKVPSHHFHFDLEKEYPVLTTKQLFFRQAILEMLWIYQAQSNDVRWLKERDVHIWDEWEIDEDGKWKAIQNISGEDGKLNAWVHQRSCDVPLGLPFNVTQYATLVNLLAQVCNLKPGTLDWSIKDAHIYVNQIDGIKEQIRRMDELGDFPAPDLYINPEIKNFSDFDNSKDCKDIKILNYKHHGKINFPIAKLVT